MSATVIFNSSSLEGERVDDGGDGNLRIVGYKYNSNDVKYILCPTEPFYTFTTQ